MSDTFGNILNGIGAISTIPLIFGARHVLLSRAHANRLLRFSRESPLDIVVTTSGFAKSPHGTARSYKTNYGEVMGIASVARALGRYYRKKPIFIHMSARIARRLESDLVVLGGPLFNDCAGEFIERFNALYPSCEIALDTETQSISVAGEYEVSGYDLARVDGIPTRDLAIAAIGSNPFSPGTGRGILCAGFSTYGTAAASDHLFDTLLRGQQGRDIRRRLRRSTAVVIVVGASFVNQQCVHCEEKFVRYV